MPSIDVLPRTLTRDELPAVAPKLERHAEQTLGQLWRRPDLSPRDRSLVTLSALIARTILPGRGRHTIWLPWLAAIFDYGENGILAAWMLAKRLDVKHARDLRVGALVWYRVVAVWVTTVWGGSPLPPWLTCPAFREPAA